MPKMLHAVLISLCALAVIYLGLAALVFLFQRQLLYFPTRSSESGLLAEAEKNRLKPWRDAKENLIGWICRHPRQPADYRIIVLHGNANHAHHCGYFAEGFQSSQQPGRWDVYLLEYPGYGARPGSPSERALVSAALEALDDLRQNDPRPVFLLGESIGSSVAAQVAARRPEAVAGLFFIAPANNLPDLASFHMPFFPARLMLKDKYYSDLALQRYKGPVAFLLAGQDEVVPTRFSRKLYNGCPGPKRLWEQKEATHNTLDYNPNLLWWKEVAEFLTSNPS